MRQVCVLISAGPTVEPGILDTPENPGVGGTAFAAFRLVSLLAEIGGGRNVLVATNQPANHFSTGGRENVLFADWSTWSASDSDCVIISNSEFRNPDVLRAVRNAGRVIAWSHHPFDRSLKTHHLPRIDAVVTPGVFAHASNSLLGFKGVHIPHYIHGSVSREPRPLPTDGPVNYVFMSSGLAIKGFWDALEVWRRVRESVPRARLHIVGATPVALPCGGASRLSSGINADVRSGRIVLHGPVGLGKNDLFAEMHIGIVNPRGLSECLPNTAYELLGSGLPIVSSSRHGMYESMRYFPESSGVTIAGIARKAVAIGCDPELHATLSERARKVVDEVHSMGPEIAARWIRLVDDEHLEATVPDLQPMWPLRPRRLRLLSGLASLLHYRLRIKRRWRRLAGT